MKATTKHTIQKGIFLAQCEYVNYLLIVNYWLLPTTIIPTSKVNLKKLREYFTHFN